MTDIAATSPADESPFYFRQLLSGRDFAQTNPIAQQMMNFSYLIGDRRTGECVVVDPAYQVDDLVRIAGEDGMKITGALVTHYHADHCGGNMMGFEIDGVSELLSLEQMPIHVQADEQEWIQKVTSLGSSDFVTHTAGSTVEIGGFSIDMLHTPGHTPGSQCFHVEGRLVSGDTLFLDGCGRTDLPGGDSEQLYYSLTQVLAKVPDSSVLYPGHMYSPQPSQLMGQTRESNFVFRPNSVEQWNAMFG